MDQHSELDQSLDDDQREKISETFKKPQLCLVGPRKGKGVNLRKVEQDKRVEPVRENDFLVLSPLDSESPSTEETSSAESQVSQNEEVNSPYQSPLNEITKSKKSSSLAPAQKLKETPIPYLEPKWGGIPEEPYSLDVIKEGSIISHINLNEKSYLVFGRLTNCDVQMAHPTVSRHHSVLQYCVGSAEKPKGFYIYDLGSTHGTYLNKNKIRSAMYVPLKVGHQIKVGLSTRFYLLQGPPEDMEDESQFTVTELKAQRQMKLKEREIAQLEKKRKEEEERQKRENEGIDWGMGDDADEETDLSENPYAATTNEELYIDDPKKTLRGWFDREGHELEYEVEEKGPGQFLCRVDVPVEGARGGCMTAEALVKGKKKEAVVQCALEACRLLDRLGLLRQATHESRKRKAKNWEEDDFYDSDDDTFLDRTGSVEKKRQQRMQQAGKAEVQVETFESLSKKHSDVLESIRSVQTQLQTALADLTASKEQKRNDEDTDTLDSFMNNLKSKGCPDKKHINKLKAELSNLQKEEAQVRKLVNIARPANLPELVLPKSLSETHSKNSDAIKNKIMLNARRKACSKHKESNEAKSGSGFTKDQTEMNRVEKGQDDEGSAQVDSTEISTGTPTETQDEDRTLLGPAMPSFLKEKIDQSPSAQEEHESVDMETNDGEEDDSNHKDLEKRKKKNRRRALQRTEKALERTKTSYDSSDPKYSVWVPPEDQSGDGKTKLNEKLGY